MAQMLSFVPTPTNFDAIGYGCGVASFYREDACGERSIGHTGGFIAHVTYMVYLPDYNVSIAVMINDWKFSCIDAIRDGLIHVVLNHIE